MRLDEARPGEWVALRTAINCEHSAEQLAQKDADAFISSYLGECFSLASKQLSKTLDEKTAKEGWALNVFLLAHEPVLKWHAQYLSNELKKKVHVTRFLFHDWNVSKEKQLELLAQHVTKPKVVKEVCYFYEHIKKCAVFYFDESKS